MATLSFTFNIPENNGYDMEELQKKLNAYLHQLISMRVASNDATQNNSDLFPKSAKGMSEEEARKYILSLQIKSDVKVPAEVNGMRDITNPKYL